MEIIKGVEVIDIPKISDARGHLGVIEKDVIPFSIKRVYYLYDVPSDVFRGGHAHKQTFEFLVALSGSFDVLLDNGEEKMSVILNNPKRGILIKSGIWKKIDNFSPGSVCLVLASDVYEESDYIRDYDEFLLFKRG